MSRPDALAHVATHLRLGVARHAQADRHAASGQVIRSMLSPDLIDRKYRERVRNQRAQTLLAKPASPQFRLEHYPRFHPPAADIESLKGGQTDGPRGGLLDHDQ